LAPGLAQGSYVIEPDLPGHGESDVVPAVSFNGIAQAIKANPRVRPPARA
jgi:hypothetical protein